MFLAGCATAAVKTPQATGGSKADGTVDLSYSFTWLEKPVVDWTTAQESAISRCQAWGYKKADAFGGHKTACQAFDGYGNCISTVVTVTYQCLD